MKRFMNKKVATVGIAVALVLGIGGAAFAYFTAGGTGTGSALTGKASTLTITQIGAGYDSLVSTSSGDPYTQDQTYGGAGISEFGNDITLANPGYQQLVSVVVAMRNWSADAITNQPISLTLYNPSVSPEVSGNVIASDTTQTFNFAAAVTPNVTPSLTNITFDFPAGTFVPQEFVYGISFDTSANNPSILTSDPVNGLNVALSSSANDLTVGTDTTPGTVWLNTVWNTIGNDFPTCTVTPPVATDAFESVITDCGPQALGNPGAYGTPTEVAAGNADVPAVQFNVIGGVAASLYPGGPSQPVDFAITNPGSSSAYVTTVHTTISSVTSDGIVADEVCSTTMYSLTGNPASVDATVLPGSTVIESPSGTTISMINDGNNQDNCEGATVSLGFTAP
jgi:hypothetical protein